MLCAFVIVLSFIFCLLQKYTEQEENVKGRNEKISELESCKRYLESENERLGKACDNVDDEIGELYFTLYDLKSLFF